MSLMGAAPSLLSYVAKSCTGSNLVSRPRPLQHKQADSDQCKCMLMNVSDSGGVLDNHQSFHSGALLQDYVSCPSPFCLSSPSSFAHWFIMVCIFFIILWHTAESSIADWASLTTSTALMRRIPTS